MKQGVRGALVAGFLLIAFVLLAGFHWSKPRILILHSFDGSVRSVVKTNEGINRILAANRQPVSVRWHYLEMNRLPDEPARQLAAAAAQRSIEQFDPDIIIAVDDEAQHYVAYRYADHPKIKLVFTAIDQSPDVYGYLGKNNVTGISELLPLGAIRETLLSARSGQPARIAVLTSRTPTGMSRLHQIESFDWAPHKMAGIHALPDFASWQKAVNDMAQNVDVILVVSHNGLHASKTDASLVPGTEIVRWLNEHARPLSIGASSEYIEEGGALAIYPSGEEMGELAAVYALDWLKSRGKKNLPFTESAHFRIGLRESMLSERKLSLPTIYMEAAHMENLYYP